MNLIITIAIGYILGRLLFSILKILFSASIKVFAPKSYKEAVIEYLADKAAPSKKSFEDRIQEKIKERS